MSSAKIDVKAFAKLNLTLEVGKLQKNGKHVIESHMVFIDFCDDLEVTKLEPHALSRYAIVWDEQAPKQTDIDWPISDDLAVRAHHLLEAEVGKPLPLQMKLQKRIPIGSGLGGGSTDAAAMLRATAKLYDLDIDLAPIAASLGSDIPFLLHGKHAVVSGTGDQVKPVDSTSLSLVLIFPPYMCQTSSVYASFDQLNPTPTEPKRNGTIYNDLLPAALNVAPSLEEDMNALKSLASVEIHLTGSGSTMFAICDNESSATEIATKINSETQCVAICAVTIEPNEEQENSQ